MASVFPVIRRIHAEAPQTGPRLRRGLSVDPTPARSSNDPVEVPTEPGAAEVPHREPGWVTLHHKVEHLAGCLGKLVDLIRTRIPVGQKPITVEVGLHWLSQYLVESDPPDAGNPRSPEREAWREAIDETGALLIDVLVLWRTERSGPDSSLRLLFEDAHGGEVQCGPIHALSHHGLVINIAECLLDRGAAEGDWRAYSLRKQVARALVDRAFSPDRLFFELHKEYMNVRRLLRPPDTPAPTRRTHRRQKSSKPSPTGRPRIPKPEVIDRTAKDVLAAAMKAGQEAGEPYVPSRADLAKTVSNALNYAIGVESLFGTKRRDGERVPRYPEFMELWKRMRIGSKEAKRRRPSHRST